MIEEYRNLERIVDVKNTQASLLEIELEPPRTNKRSMTVHAHLIHLHLIRAMSFKGLICFLGELYSNEKRHL